jgi:hypothetical protein
MLASLRWMHVELVKQNMHIYRSEQEPASNKMPWRPCGRDMSFYREATTTILTALLALPMLQYFRCRHSKVGMSMTFSELCLTTVFTISLHVCAVAGIPQGQPRHRLLTLPKNPHIA